MQKARGCLVKQKRQTVHGRKRTMQVGRGWPWVLLAELVRLGLVADKLGLTGLGLELAQIGPLVWVMKSLLKWAFWVYKMGLDWTQNGP